MRPDGPRIVEGRVHVLHAFDVADAIELAAIPSVLRPERARILRRRPAPEYVSYAVPPVELALGERALELDGKTRRLHLSARLFDFGAVSVDAVLELPQEFEALPRFAEALGQAEILSLVRGALDELLAEVRPALDGHGSNDLVEDYFVFRILRLDPVADTETLLRHHRGVLAAVLNLDATPLSPQQVDESLRDPVCYTPEDLFVADWGAALVVDEDGWDTLLVLEYLNVQLVELRFLDVQLDAALARYTREIYREPGVWSAVRGPHRGAIRELSERMTEAQRLSERVENAVKLVPDVYLARVHRRTAARLGLPTWERIVGEKLEAARHLAGVLVERAAATRADTLELTIIALIALEIVLALLGVMA